MLRGYELNASDEVKDLLVKQMLFTYRQHTKQKEEDKEQLTLQFNELTKKLNRLEEHFVNEEIDRDMFYRYKDKFIAERKELEQSLANTGNKVSNLEVSMKKVLDISSKLTAIWTSSDYHQKQILQNMVFPKGFTYNRKNDTCRTVRVNEIFSRSAAWVRVLDENKNGNNTDFSNVPAFVVRAATVPT